MFGLSTSHMVIIAVVAIMLFGDRLPEVARSFGKQFSELKKGLGHVEREFKSAMNDSPSSSNNSSSSKSSSASASRRIVNYNPIDDSDESTAPKFEPPPAE